MQTRQQAWLCSPPLWLNPAGPSLRTLSTSLWREFKIKLSTWQFKLNFIKRVKDLIVNLASSRNTVPMFQLWLALHSWSHIFIIFIEFVGSLFKSWHSWWKFYKVWTWCTSFQDFRTFAVISSLTACVWSKKVNEKFSKNQEKVFVF